MEKVFAFDDYKDYLNQRLAVTGATRGLRSRLARHLSCQEAHISQVLNGNVHFTLESGALINEFLEHNFEESETFLLLLQIARAGNRSLANTYKRRLNALRKERQRAKIESAESVAGDSAFLALYYRSWHIAGAHVFLMTGAKDRLAVARNLGISLPAAEEALLTLMRLGLATETNGSFFATAQRWHLPPDSPLVAQHHLNWRRRAILNLEHGGSFKDLHYSGPMAISHKAADAIRNLLIETIERTEPLIAYPGEEVTRALCIDFFNLDYAEKMPL